MSETIEADICVIGAGSAGLSVAAGAAQLGARTVLIEKARLRSLEGVDRRRQGGAGSSPGGAAGR
jgi:glycine/D-amino acid oxidase-like deaminating enzyme